GEPRAVAAWRRQRSAAAEPAVAGRPAGIPQIPDEEIHPRPDRERRRGPTAATSATAPGSAGARLARVAAHDFTGGIEDVELHFTGRRGEVVIDARADRRVLRHVGAAGDRHIVHAV